MTGLTHAQAVRNMIDLGLEGLVDFEEIGEGGFGVVYKATQVDFGRTVAVKAIVTPIDVRLLSRFDRERRSMGALTGHPYIVTVFSGGLSPTGYPFIIMEYMEGGSLDEVIERRPYSWREAATIGRKIAQALDAAHGAGVLHRDVKPENILLSQYGEPKLSDFGLARLEGATKTTTGVVTASLAHAAPEILEGQSPSVASDVYSLASSVYTLIVGMPPFIRSSDVSLSPIIMRIRREPVPDLRAAHVPDAVCRVLERAMAKSPADRPPSAATLERELAQALVAAEHERLA